MPVPVQTGLARLLADGQACLAGKRFGLIANPTAVDGSLHHAIDLLYSDSPGRLTVLFGPEHGIRGAAQYMVAVETATDPQSGLPVHSLYGSEEATLSPPAAILEDLDCVIFDIQDIGSRYYTYVWTMVHAMRACAAAGVEFLVLDRPNPLGGLYIEGATIHSGFHSFVGLCSVPNRHGLTVGEMARLIHSRESMDLELTVVPMQGWSRAQLYDQTGLPWVMPSPNMPTLDTALVYPGMCLLEGTEVSEGRGTTRPFEIIGAPFIDGHRLANALSKLGLPGVGFRPMSFIPTFDKFVGELCNGVQLHVTDRATFAPYRTGIALLWTLRSLWTDEFQWRTKAYEFVDDVPAIDLLCGSAAIREGINAGVELDQLFVDFANNEREFAAEREPHLFYG